VEVAPDGFRGFAVDYGGQGFCRGLLDVAEAAEVGEQALTSLCADTWDIQQLRIAVAHSSALAMVADGEAVALIPDELNEMQNR
jgi:hypothetical protein